MCVFFASQTVDKLREHLSRHLPRLGKKKIDSLVVSYVAKLVGILLTSVCVCGSSGDKERSRSSVYSCVFFKRLIVLQVIFI